MPATPAEHLTGILLAGASYSWRSAPRRRLPAPGRATGPPGSRRTIGFAPRSPDHADLELKPDEGVAGEVSPSGGRGGEQAPVR